MDIHAWSRQLDLDQYTCCCITYCCCLHDDCVVRGPPWIDPVDMIIARAHNLLYVPSSLPSPLYGGISIHRRPWAVPGFFFLTNPDVGPPITPANSSGFFGKLITCYLRGEEQVN
jgi:hypothetical protein